MNILLGDILLIFILQIEQVLSPDFLNGLE